jgi:hypothetical protein
MAWPNLFRRRTEKTCRYVIIIPNVPRYLPKKHTDRRSCWGYDFEWTDEHLTPEQTEPLKHSYDVLGEECLEVLNSISPPHKGALPRSNNQHLAEITGTEKEKEKAVPVPPRDLYVLLKDNHASNEKLSQLWEEVNTIPPWVDWAQIERGQDVFYRYGGPCLTGLTYQSLLGGMGAARVVETLARTGGFSIQAAKRRLHETTQHMLQCTRSLESIQPGGAGFASSIRVRLLHAAVRQRILKLAKERPSYFNVKEWGVPVNDLDQIGTIGTFCATLIWISLPRQGIHMRQQEKADYVALWRYIGYLLGTPTDIFETPSKAKAMMESLLYYEIHPSDMSKLLANNIIHSLERQPPTYVSPDMLVASARWLNGNDLGDSLGLPRPSLYYWALMAGQCLFFMGLCYSHRAIPSWDRRKIANLKRIFWHFIVDSKHALGGTETVFDFKYVPDYGTVTEMGAPSDLHVNSSVEMRNLKALGIFCGVVGVGAWASLKVTSMIIRSIW